ncbi:MAG: cytochrome c [Pseudomonadota bacterium]
MYVGADIFQKNCAMCHGTDGSGRVWIGQFIEPPAADLRALKLPPGRTREALRTRVKNGVAGSAMPAWRYVLEDAQIESVIDYVCDVVVRAGC